MHFVIIMHHYFILLTLVATSCSKSIRFASNEDVESSTITRLATIPSILPSLQNSAKDENLGSERSLLILTPTDEESKERTDEENEETLCTNQKMKRCKAPVRRERVSMPINNDGTNHGVPRSKHIQNLYKKKSADRSTNRSPRLRLVALKNAKTSSKNDETSGLSSTKQVEAHQNERDAIIKAIQEKLKSKDYNLAGAQRGTNVYDDDKYVCYCREKYNLPSRKVQDPASRPQWLTQKSKTDKKEDSKKILNEKKQRPKSGYNNIARQPILSDRLPKLHQDAPRYSPHLPSRKMKPILQHPYDGIERLPYVPYIYQLDPEHAMPDTIFGGNPMRYNIPFDSIADRPDSIVGQARIPQPGDSDQTQETVGQTACPSNLARGPSRSSPKKISAASTATSVTDETLKNDLYDRSRKVEEENLGMEAGRDHGNSDYNLQSKHLGFTEDTTLNSVDGDETSRMMLEDVQGEKGLPTEVLEESKGEDEPENTYVQAGNPEMRQNHETTGSGNLDYSEIKEVTNSYFTSKAYSDEPDRTNGDIGSSGFPTYDDFYITSIGPINIGKSYDSGPRSRSEILAGMANDVTTEMAPEEAPNVGMRNPDSEGSELQTANPEDPQSRSNVFTDVSNDFATEMSAEQPAPNVETKNPDNEASEFQTANSEDPQSRSNVFTEVSNDFATEMSPEQSPESAPDVGGKNADNVSSELRNSNPEEANENEGDSILGKNNPSWDRAAMSNDDLNENPVYDIQSPEDNTYEPAGSSYLEGTTMFEGLTPTYGASPDIEDRTARSSMESSAEDYWSESPETEDNGGPLRSDYEGDNFERKNDTDEKGPAGDETIYSVESVSDYATIEDPAKNKGVEDDDSPVESTLKTNAEESRDSLPFCDNTLLQKSIKAVINNFATEDPAEMDEETVGSTADDLRGEIVEVPNLKGILSMPPIENTIVDKVKNLLTKVTGVARHNLDNNWATDVIRNNLRHMTAALPNFKEELPANTVEERQFKDGKWVTRLVTVEPESNDENPPSSLDKLQASVKSLLRDPAVNLQAARQPAVQNMIVQSVRNTFKPEDTSNEKTFDEEAVQSVLDKELSLMEMEDTGLSTTESAMEADNSDMSDIDMQKILEIAKEEAGLDEGRNYESSTLKIFADTPEEDPENWSVSKTSSKTTTLNSPEGSIERDSFEGSTVENTQSGSGTDDHETELVGSPYQEAVSQEEATNPEETSTRTATSTKLPVSSVELLNDGFVGASRDLPTEYIELSSAEATTYPTMKENQSGLQLSTEEQEETRESSSTTRTTEEVSEAAENKWTSTDTVVDIVAATSGDQQQSAAASKEDTPMQTNISRMSSVKTVETTESEVDSSEFVGMERNIKYKTDEAAPESDFTYLGKISVKNDNPTDDVTSLQNSELFYVGDGVKLPLEIRKLDDGSYALSISRKVCEHLLKKECPCCVPRNGNVVGRVKKSPDAIRRKIISKRDSWRPILPKEHDSADDGSQIFSMPVETFARRYNLSLNLKKLQAPWKFDEKIDERSRKNLENKRGNADGGLLQNLLSVQADSGKDKLGGRERVDREYRVPKRKQRDFENYRYERNINEGVNKRAEFVKNVLNRLREMILNANER